jgi:hypothetical protein
MHQADQVTVELTVAIKDGDVPALERLLAARPGLASERITGRKGGTSTPLHIVTDWPGYFPNGPAIVRILIEAGADPDACRGRGCPRHPPGEPGRLAPGADRRLTAGGAGHRVAAG